MLLQVCDQCGRPLSEGAIARGEAVARDGDTICTQCVARGAAGGQPEPAWRCESCGIPVTAQDLIDGRAARLEGVLRCSRCISPSVSGNRTILRAMPLPAARTHPSRSTRAAEEFVQGARKEHRFPALPVVLFLIVLPMFAISVWFAVTAQNRLNLMNAELANRSETPRPPQPAPQTPVQPAPPQATPQPPEPPPAAPVPSLSAETAAELAAVERELAAPVILKLQSEHLADVWEGLIEAGSMRLIGARPQVRALLMDRDDDTRAIASRVAAMLGDNEALPKLGQMVDDDPSEPVRMEARKARDRLAGRATREIQDMTDAELQELMRGLEQELQRRRAGNE